MSSSKRKAPRQKLAPSWSNHPPAFFRFPHGELRLSGQDDSLTEIAQHLLRAVGAGPIAHRVSVIWNARLKTTAGTACPRDSCIELNPLLRAFGPAQVRRTLKHEAAHLIAHWRAGRRFIQTHGDEWRQACEELGIAGEPAFHELPLPRKRIPRKFAYRCRHCGFTVQRVRPFAPYTACYKCCMKHSEGKYHSDFLFLRIPFPPPLVR
jgi:predicted SprT family Zn-dependent metalloprotease